MSDYAPFERLLVAKEVAHLLKVSPCQVYRRVRDGSLRAYRVAPTRKGLRFKPDDVRRFLAASVVDPV